MTMCVLITFEYSIALNQFYRISTRMRNALRLASFIVLCAMSSIVNAQQAYIQIFDDNDSTTLTESLSFDTQILNSYFPNTTNTIYSAVGGRLYLKVGDNGVWDVYMFSNNVVEQEGLIHNIYNDEVILLKYRASSWEGSYDNDSLVDGQLYAGDFVASYRWLRNSTTGSYQDADTLVASSHELPLSNWDYENDSVEIIFLLGLQPGDEGQGYNPNLTADKPGAYRTNIVFEMESF